MPEVIHSDQFVACIEKSGLVKPDQLRKHLDELRAADRLPEQPAALARTLVQAGLLTDFQVTFLLKGKHKGLIVGKYKILAPLGQGGMGRVFLGEHNSIGSRVALKLLTGIADDDMVAVERFHREARAQARLHHPNLVRSHDFDHEGKYYYFVMDYVDGVNLQELVGRHGPLDPIRAAHYLSQACLGLEYLHDAGLVHRDIKPSNLLLDRQGTVKILDLGLARFLDEKKDNLTQKYDSAAVLGTADFLSPEQALRSSGVDHRADFYSLGATAYLLLTGRVPFEGKNAAQKLLMHQVAEPPPITNFSPDVPEGLTEVVRTLMSKSPDNRYSTAGEIIEALAPWTQDPIDPPSEDEMPQTLPVALRSGPASGSSRSSSRSSSLSSRARSEGSTARLNRTVQGPSSRRTQAEIHIPEEAEDEVQQATETSTAPRRLWPVVLAGVMLAVVVAGGTVLTLQLLTPKPPTETTQKQDDPPQPRPAVPARARGVVPAGALLVTAADEPGTFRTVQDALHRARPGSRILVVDHEISERLVLIGPMGQGMTVESWPPTAPAVRWKAPSGQREGEPIIHLANVEGLRIKGFEIDGEGRVETLVRLSGTCPGLTLEGLSLEGFQKVGVGLSGCSGAEGKAVELDKVRIATRQHALAALSLDGASTRFLLVQRSRFEGPFQAAIRVECPLTDSVVRGNRFFQVNSAVLFAKAQPQAPVVLEFASNTIFQGQAGLRFERLPSQDSQLTVRENLFARTNRLSDLTGLKAPADAPAWLQATGNVRCDQSREGWPALDARVEPLDPSRLSHLAEPNSTK